MYIGQSKRCLQKIKQEHERAVRNNYNKSVLATHAFTQSHEIEFDKISVLATEKNRKKRLFLEMLNIDFHENTLNIMQDTMFLKKILNRYKKTLCFIKKIFLILNFPHPNFFVFQT